MIFTTKALSIVRLNFNAPISDFINAPLTKQKKGSIQRKVYFTRYIGEERENELENTIREIDEAFQKRDIAYLRTSALHNSVTPGQVQDYIKAYEAWQKVQHDLPQNRFALSFPYHFKNDSLEWTQKCAFEKTLALYKEVSPGSNASMEKNFAVKLLGWMSYYLPLLVKENSSENPKFVYIGEIKKQELLFLYFLNQMGCDVLYMNPVQDIETICPECNSFSKAYSCPFKRQSMPAIKENPPQKQETVSSKQETNGTRRGSIHLEGRHRVSPTLQPSNGQPTNQPQPRQVTPRPTATTPTPRTVATTPAPSVPRSNSAPTPSVPKIGERQNIAPIRKQHTKELSYEELAQLSTSIVMISVLDRNGQVLGTGSGVVIHENGYILTNFHVVRGGASFAVQFENEEQSYVTDRVVKYHDTYDLAVIKVEKDCLPIPIYIGDKLVRGQKVVAIGSPLGLFNTISDGIISAFRQTEKCPMIQITAPTSPGSSGGAVLDMYGRLIGIVKGGFSEGQNLNVAIDNHTIYQFANAFLQFSES